MNRIILSIFPCLLIAFIAQGQTHINLEINHWLGNTPFAFEQTAQNNLGNDFNVTRLQYYMSEISLIHDGGNETLIEDLYVFADAGSTTEVDLGIQDISQLEGISFHIGVDSFMNHNNPVDLPAEHPLAPKTPSMHWGWAAGYRFVAMEGNAGSALDQSFQFHALGDRNYNKTTIILPTTELGEKANIHINADYTRVLENLSVEDGAIVHGSEFEAVTVLDNFKDYVFSSANLAVSNHDIHAIKSFDILPNPSQAENISIRINSDLKDNSELIITDILGREIDRYEFSDSIIINGLNVNNAGIYFATIFHNGKAILNKKILIE